MNGRLWTQDEDDRLVRMLERHTPMATIARRLARTLSGIRTRATRLGFGGVTTAAGDLTANKAARLLGVEHHTLTRWIRDGHLHATRTRVRYARGCMFALTREAIEAFLASESNWHRIDPARIADPALRSWATEIRGGRYFLRLHEIERRLSYGFNSAGNAVQSGRLRAVRDARGPWLVRDDWLPDLAAPPRQFRPRPLRALRPEQCSELAERWGQESVVSLALRFGVSGSAVHRAARRLGLPSLGKGHWAVNDRRRKSSRAAAGASPSDDEAAARVSPR